MCNTCRKEAAEFAGFVIDMYKAGRLSRLNFEAIGLYAYFIALRHHPELRKPE